MSRSSLSLAFLLGLIAGILLGEAWEDSALPLWVAGGLVLVLGALLVVHEVQRSRRIRAEKTPGSDPAWEAAPPIGQMLVHYQLISEADLVRALERQGKTKELLGRVLVKMKLITYVQLANVLEEQFSRRHHTPQRARWWSPDRGEEADFAAPPSEVTRII